jgi:uncharacterized protein YbaR (Trm112 family)
MDYEVEDKLALHRALLSLLVCPKCRKDLRPAYTSPEGTYACVACDETWHLPSEIPDHPTMAEIRAAAERD